MKTSRIIAMAALVAILILAMGLMSACAPAATPTTAPKPPEPTKAPVVEPTKAPPAPTVPPPAPTAPPKPTAAPVPPEAKLVVVAVPGVVTANNALTATIKTITDTAVGAKDRVVALSTTGGNNVPIKVPVHLEVSPEDPKNSGTPTWTLVKPADSKAVITSTTKDVMTAEFTPDVVGAYYVRVNLKNAAGLTGENQFQFINAGTYIGVYTGKCATCHPKQSAEWAKTGHATVMPHELDNKVNGPRGMESEYAETCSSCHTTGYYPAPYNGAGGYFDAKEKAKWTFPTWKQIDAVWAKTAPSIYDAAPVGVKDMATIGCEQCHGPAAQHVNNGAKVMDASWDSGVCNQCHGTRGGHTRGLQLGFSAHSDREARAWEIAGPGEQSCVRCHTAQGYVSFIANPKNPAAWSNEAGTLGCAACHDPHSEELAFQLRVVGKPMEIPFTLTKDVGLSATCYECHNIRRNSEEQMKNAADKKAVSTPHYSSAAEMLSDLGGFTYGATLPNSPHGMMVGAAPIANPTYDAKDGESRQFLFSAVGDKKGNIPGSCVTCHMTAGVTSPVTGTLTYKVGGHSFNTVTPDGKLDYGASCKPCHGEVKDFNLKSKADYDGNGKTEGVQDEMKGLLNVLFKALEAKGVKKTATGATLPTDADAKIQGAWFNFRFVNGLLWGGENGEGNQGAAAAMHNFKRSVALLQLSLKDLTGSLPAGMTEMK